MRAILTVYKVLGIMSGTSLDGMDMAFCRLVFYNGKWKFKLLKTVMFPYEKTWKQKLASAHTLRGGDLIGLHKEYGRHVGNLVEKFMRMHKITPQFIASHGHTVFHDPDSKVTFQLGDGSEIAAACRLPVVCDFRSADVALGGQGAPLVPIGDEHLFPGYDFCLNLGGIANISFRKNKKRIAFDICPVNMVLNTLSEAMDRRYDKDGSAARRGKVNMRLLTALNRIAWYRHPPPKSLGREWVGKTIFPILRNSKIPVPDKLRTYCEHISIQIGLAIRHANKRKDLQGFSARSGSALGGKNLAGLNAATVFTTGGGAHNRFLIERIRANTPATIVIPDKEIVDFKEALVFAFLGVLRWRGEVNALASVTGAGRDSVGGVITLSLSSLISQNVIHEM